MQCGITEQSGVWTVPLSAKHTAYSSIFFTRGRSAPNYVVILVDTKKFIAMYENNNDSLSAIPRADTWPPQQLAGLSSFLQPTSSHPEMPRLTFSFDEVRTWRSLWFKQRRPCLTFGNGRHRLRYLEYAGAPCIPVEVGVNGANFLADLCGC
ncbi:MULTISPECIES: plasmid fertility inhibition factor family protein [Pseudomonas syringae group]|nr:hypothetical protein PSPTOT1_2991 [Pseudomonas syringae pv. tomato T1]